MIDTGFHDTNVVRLTLRAIRVKTAVAQARASVEALAHLLEQQREPLACDGSAVREQRVGLPSGDQEGGVERGAVGGAESHALREDELLQGVKLVAQLLDRVEVGIRHGLFSSAGAEKGIEPAGAAHRLLGGLEKTQPSAAAPEITAFYRYRDDMAQRIFAALVLRRGWHSPGAIRNLVGEGGNFGFFSSTLDHLVLVGELERNSEDLYRYRGREQ